jgi:hypothetical protein
MVLDTKPQAIPWLVTGGKIGTSVALETLTTTKGTSTVAYWNSLTNTAGTFTPPTFNDGNKVCMNWEIMYEDESNQNLFLKFEEVYVAPNSVSIRDGEEIAINITGQCYGAITVSNDQADFTTHSNLTWL